MLEEYKTRQILEQIIKDMDDFAAMKGIDYPPIYLLGGSGCIIAGYFGRATTDIDLIDMEYEASVGRLLRILDKYDLLDLYLTTIPEDFKERAVKIGGYKNIYVLSKEDIILSKIGRFSHTDIEDISLLFPNSSKLLIKELTQKVLSRKNISTRVKTQFINNLRVFKEKFNV